VYLIVLLVNSFYAHAFLNRPITIVPLLGLFLGDLHTGVLLGAQLELLFIGITTIGGSLPSDVTLAGILVGAFVIGGGVSMELAMPLAVAIGVVSAMFTLMNRIIVAGAYVPFFDNWAAKGQWKAYIMWNVVGQVVLCIVPVLVTFFAIYLGSGAVTAAMNAIPAAIQHGIAVASSMMPAVGIALLMSMLWSTKMSIYFYLGFALTVYLKINMTAMIFIAAFITIVQVYNEMNIRDRIKAATSKSGEGDLFG